MTKIQNLEYQILYGTFFLSCVCVSVSVWEDLYMIWNRRGEGEERGRQTIQGGGDSID